MVVWVLGICCEAVNGGGGLGRAGHPWPAAVLACSWFFVLSSSFLVVFRVLGLRISPLSTCQHVNVSPRSYASENSSTHRSLAAVPESLKRPSVRLGAPTACARHWLSQRKTVHQKLPILSSKIVIEINTQTRCTASRGDQLARWQAAKQRPPHGGRRVGTGLRHALIAFIPGGWWQPRVAGGRNFNR